MTEEETAIAALENLASSLDTTATIMRRLGNPYRNKSQELSGAWEMVQEWIAAIRLEAEGEELDLDNDGDIAKSLTPVRNGITGEPL